MEQTLKTWWLKMSEARLRNHLTLKLKYPGEIVERIVQQVLREREDQRKRSIRKTVGFKAWQEMLAPARAELATVRVLKSQLKRGAAEDDVRWDTLCQYEDCISALIEKLKKVQAAGEHNPTQFVAFLKTSVSRHIPNNGTFWVDFVPLKQRQHISTLFDKLPPPARGKKKVPFERRLPRAMHNAQRNSLYAQLEKVQQSTEVERGIAQNSFDIEHLDAMLLKIHNAKYNLDQTPRNKPLPATWHGLLK